MMNPKALFDKHKKLADDLAMQYSQAADEATKAEINALYGQARRMADKAWEAYIQAQSAHKPQGAI